MSEAPVHTGVSAETRRLAGIEPELARTQPLPGPSVTTTLRPTTETEQDR